MASTLDAAAPQPRSSTPTTSHGLGNVSNIFLEFDSNTVLVSSITPKILLAVVGPRVLSEPAPLTNGKHTGSSSETSELDQGGNAQDLAQLNGSSRSSESSDTHPSKPSHQRRASEDLAPHSSPLVLEALEHKSEALTKYLKEIMGEINPSAVS